MIVVAAGAAVMIVVMVMVVMGVAVALLEEGGLDLQDAVEVEGVAAQHGVERHVGALRPVERRIGVDGADARLDLGQLVAA